MAKSPQVLTASPSAYATLPPAVKTICDQQDFDNWTADQKKGPGVRVALIGIHNLMERAGLDWGRVRKVTWAGSSNLVVAPAESLQDLQKNLLSAGFRDEWLAKSAADLWGLRKTIGSIGLHIRGKSDGQAEFHIDLNPPRWWALLGLWHVIMDSWLRESTHTPDKVEKALTQEKAL